jgi:hypothetical protein
MESKTVPNSIITTILDELDLMYVNREDCPEWLICDILRGNDLQIYYRNRQQIYCYITNKEAKFIPRRTEELIIEMFKQVERIYKVLKHNRRKFLNYSYLLNKLFYIIDMPDIAICFPLLKSEKHLIEHDEIFSQICEQLNWKFYPSL